MNKTLYCIRHGTGVHNVLAKTLGEKSFIKTKDPPLTKLGIKEAKKLRESSQLNDIQLVIVSPLIRTLQTMNIIFKNFKGPVIALTDIIEIHQSLHIFNKMQSIDNLKKKFPRVDFKYISKSPWSFRIRDYVIEKKKVLKRIENLKNWLSSRPENHIAIVSHNGFLCNLLSKKHIKNCILYKTKI